MLLYRFADPYNQNNGLSSILRLCSGLTLSGASLSYLKRRGVGAAEWVNPCESPSENDIDNYPRENGVVRDSE